MIGMSMEDMRKEKRHACNIPIEFHFVPRSGVTYHPGPWKNFTKDISYSGVAVFSKYPAMEGQKVEIFLRHVFNDPLLGQVKWCEKHSEDLYLIGLKYL